MVVAFPNIGYHISEKESLRGKMDIFYLGACQVARSLLARLAGLDGLPMQFIFIEDIHS